MQAVGRLKRKGWRRARWHTIVVCNLSVFSQYTRERKSLVAAACVRAYCQLVFASDTATRLAISQAAENKVHHVSHADGVCVCVYASPLRRVHYNNIIWNNTTHTGSWIKMVAQNAIIRKVGVVVLMKYMSSSKKGCDFAKATTSCDVSGACSRTCSQVTSTGGDYHGRCSRCN
jgi:hypothetical protein